MIKSAQDVIEIAKRRGFGIRLDPGPPVQPMLNGDPKEATPVLMDALKAWRVEIIEELSRESPHG